MSTSSSRASIWRRSDGHGLPSSISFGTPTISFTLRRRRAVFGGSSAPSRKPPRSLTPLSGSLGFTAQLWLLGYQPWSTGTLSLASLMLLRSRPRPRPNVATPLLVAVLYASSLLRVSRDAPPATTFVFLGARSLGDAAAWFRHRADAPRLTGDSRFFRCCDCRKVRESVRTGAGAMESEPRFRTSSTQLAWVADWGASGHRASYWPCCRISASSVSLCFHHDPTPDLPTFSASSQGMTRRTGAARQESPAGEF